MASWKSVEESFTPSKANMFACFLFILISYAEAQEVAHKISSYELDSKFWQENAQKTLINKEKYTFNKNEAKKVIFFLGDGMSMSTLTATRIFYDNESLSFEKFPISGFSKTYCVDSKVADSACSATAYLGGVKGNIGTIGVNAHVNRSDCEAMTNQSNHVYSIAKWFQDKGCGSGVVTKTRVTHASPAGIYAHCADRWWESDSIVASLGFDPETCHDIAYQMVMGETGKNLNVVMGGGSATFLPVSEGGNREDGRNLLEIWKQSKIDKRKKHAYVTSKQELESLMARKICPEYVLGLYSLSHMDNCSDKNPNQPSLPQMTLASMKILDQNHKCWFLMVEGSHIDLANHDNKAVKAMMETKELSETVAAARSASNVEDTLIVVTADHAHTLAISGYTNREASLVDPAGLDDYGKPYYALSYATGPGYRRPDGQEPTEDRSDPEFRNEALRGIAYAGAHGGDDVGVFASGPWEHLFTGSFQQNYIPHAMAYAANVGDGRKCRDNARP